MSAQTKVDKNRVVKNSPGKVQNFILENIVWLLLIVTILLMGMINPIFYTGRILMNILVQGSILGILSAAMAFSLLIGEIDLSIVGIAGITAAIGTIAMNNGLNWVLAVILMLVMGIIIGWFNGFLIARLKAVSLIQTLALQITFTGGVMAITKGRSIINFPDVYKFAGQGRIGGVIPLIVIIFLLVFIICHIVWTRTALGRSLFAVGGNANSAHVSGIRVDRIRILAFIISGGLAAFAGYLLSSYMGAVTCTFGTEYMMHSIAAAVIGGVSIKGGRGSITGVLGGTLLLTVMNVGLQVLGISSYYVEMSGGLMIFAAVVIDAIRLRVQG